MIKRVLKTCVNSRVLYPTVDTECHPTYHMLLTNIDLCEN